MNEIHLQSCFYEGTVRHRRFIPRSNAFCYRVFMAYFDVEKLSTLFSSRWLFSLQRFSLIRFKRSDYIGNASESILTSVKKIVGKEINQHNVSKVMLLTNLRFWGFLINPISCYYCFNNHGQLCALVLEVTNTPWGERQTYVLACNPKQKNHRSIFNKMMHVSPFNPMDMVYDWRNNVPNTSLSIHMDVVKDKVKHLDATVKLKRVPFSKKNARRLWIRYPIMTFKVAASIYWQALKILLKKIPPYPHPKKDASIK